MIKFKKFLTYTSVSTLALALVPWASAWAAPTLLVDPYDNIPKSGTSLLSVTGAGLVPNASIEVFQRSFAPYSEAEGDVGTGVKVEQRFVAQVFVDANGILSDSVPVSYDIVVDGPQNMDYCDTISSLQRLCTLLFRYVDGPLSGETLLDQKLYFGMSGPVVTPPPSTVPMTKDDCKEDKWSDFTLGFKNQGACVSYVASKQ